MKAYRVHEGKSAAEKFGLGRFDTMARSELDAGDVLIRVAFASVNYKDALTTRGKAKIARKFPLVAGIDLAGVVESSNDRRFRAGDEVIVHNHGLGVDHDGGYAEFGCFPADWVIPLPAGLTLFEASALGVASVAIDILAGRGYHIVALSGKPQQADYLKSLGAKEVIGRSDCKDSGRPLERQLWAGAVDSVGGAQMSWLTRSMRRNGVIASFGNAGGAEFAGNLLPFILRGVRLLGVNVNNPHATMRRIWGRLASDLKPRQLERIARRIRFDDLEAAFDDLLAARVTGRRVVDFSLG